MPATHSAHTDTDTLIRQLDAAENAPDAVAIRARSYQLLTLEPDVTVVDVGCGTGRAVEELAQHAGRAVGVDLDPSMLGVARARYAHLDFREADADRLPFEDGAVHGYRADKVFHMLPDPAAALTEARRVLAPGGRIVLIGQDWDTIVIDSDDADLTWRIVHARAATIPHPRIARAYRTLLLDAGFRDATLEVHTLLLDGDTACAMLLGHAGIAQTTGAITADEHRRWTSEQRERAGNGRLTLAVPMFVAAATA
ncbi:methyltransferase domain-containing protein [Dactylosporangium sp. CS-033363]|uniref:methyltransferase domain-containing protein n=1 Tax=Dactylosporangium sp. CS-033363 TaxID=3239935 RepID=UPI003D8DFFD1